MEQRYGTNQEQTVLFAAPHAAPAEGTEPWLCSKHDSSRLVKWIIATRAARRQFFDEHLFADPAWDMLLELYSLECDGRRISVSKLSIAAGVPCTTTLRWIDKLESEGLIIRAPDPLDGRRVWIGLSRSGLETMHSYVEQVATEGMRS